MTNKIDSTNNIDNEKNAKKTLATVTKKLMTDLEKDHTKKVTKSIINVYQNIINNNFMKSWAKGYKEIEIKLDSYQSFFTFEFLPPKMDKDFITRFINGKESLNGFLHKTPTIKIKMSPRIFHQIKDPNDVYNFFKSAITYYDSKIDTYGNKLMLEIMKLDSHMKYLISTTKLMGLVTYPLTLLFVFSDVNITNKNTFKINNEDIKCINSFIHHITDNYNSPEKEKKKIVDDVTKLVKSLRESCTMTDTIKELYYLPESVNKLLFGGYSKEIQESTDKFITEQLDNNIPKNPEVKYLMEAFGVKKLKKIPKNLIPYIQIETEAIRDYNDKMILSSYTLGKIEIVEWYIELLTVGSKKYIVPHTKPYLEVIRAELLKCFKNIMDVQIKNTNTEIDIDYPKGYEG